MKIMGIDLGEARTGIAMSDATGFLASPYEVIADHRTDAVLNRVLEIARAERVALAVVGLPKHINGDEGAGAEKARSFCAALEQNGVKTQLWDERYSTVIAHQYYNESGKKGAQKRRKTVDSAAAAVILQGYLDYAANRPAGSR